MVWKRREAEEQAERDLTSLLHLEISTISAFGVPPQQSHLPISINPNNPNIQISLLLLSIIPIKISIYSRVTHNTTPHHGSSPSYLSVTLENPLNRSPPSPPSPPPFWSRTDPQGVPGTDPLPLPDPATPAPATPCISSCSDCDSRILRKFTVSTPFDVAGTIYVQH